MAPDKIWVTTSEKTALLSERRHDYDVAYIREDALMEWIDEYKNYSSGPSWDLLKTHIESL